MPNGTTKSWRRLKDGVSLPEAEDTELYQPNMRVSLESSETKPMVSKPHIKPEEN